MVGLKYNGDTLNKRGLGGSESAIIYMSKELTKLNFDVTVFCKSEKDGVFNGVKYIDISNTENNKEYFDVLITSRSCLPYIPLKYKDKVLAEWKFNPKWTHSLVSKCKYKILWLHDTFCAGDNWLEYLLVNGYYDEVFTLSDWHTHYICQAEHGGHPKRKYEVIKHKLFQTRNGIHSYYNEIDIIAKDKNLFVYNASVTKGMIPLLEKCWGKIKQDIPDAKLVVVGGYYKGANNGKPDEQEQKYWELKEKYHNKNGVEFTGIITQQEIADILSKASLFVYPTIFPETFGISTIEAINYNVPIVSCRFGAIEEVAPESVSFLIDYPIDYNECQIDKFVSMVKLAYNDDYLRQQKTYACNAFKPWLGWDKVALQWKHHIYKKLGLYLDVSEIKNVRKITGNLTRLFSRRHINQEDYYEDYSMDYKRKIIVVSPVYNAEKYIKECIDSVASQLYNNYKHYIIDDLSTDNTFNIAKETINNLSKDIRNKFVLIKNKNKKYALGNQIETIKKYANIDDIIVLLDGDDKLVNKPDIFNYINRQYEEGIKFTYGSCYSLADKIPLIAQPYPKNVHKNKSYRQHLFNWGMPYTHLRTFSKELFDLVDESNFKDDEGNYYVAGGDNALFYPLIEQCEESEIRAIQRVLYMYNDSNPLNDYKINKREQNRVANTIRKQKNVLIAIPTAKNIETDTFLSIYRQELPIRHKTYLECFYGYNIDQVRNLIAHYTIINNYDYVFCVDSDIVLPNDALKRLLKHNVDIVSGTYIQRKPNECIPEVYVENNKGGITNIDSQLLQEKGLMEVAGCGFGCVLIKKNVLENIDYPQFEYHSSIDFKNTISEDIDFCIKAKNKGYKIYVDTNVKCEHIANIKLHL